MHHRLSRMIRICCACLLLLLLYTAALADGEWPELNEAGYLDSGEFVYADADAGLWRYCSTTLKVEIIRYSESEPTPVVWYEAEVWSREETFGMITNTLGKHFTSTDWPTNVCSKRGAVLAINGDYATARYSKIKSKKTRNYVGILIRDGEILSQYTQPTSYNSFPNLDSLALFADGDMQVYDRNEKTAQEYLDMGARDVLSFGPWLLRDGEINPRAYRISKSNSPRTAIGMVEKGHYFAMMLEGRHKASHGGNLVFLAEKLQARGCVTGFNLDGGETACILFMGQQINKVGSSHSKQGYARRGSEFLAIGTSALVAGYDPDAE